MSLGLLAFAWLAGSFKQCFVSNKTNKLQALAMRRNKLLKLGAL